MNSARTPLIVGNWKAGPPRTEARALAERLVQTLAPISRQGVELVVCPPLPWLTDVAQAVAGAEIALGAQTVAALDTAAATGEVPASLLRGLCRYALLGHYERRILCGERDGDVRKKVQAAFKEDIHPVVCVGESADGLDQGEGAIVVEQQLEAALDGLSVDDRLVVAYAPSWTTIGMVTPPPPAYANEICRTVRGTLASIASPSLAASVRVIYGGRLAESNIAEVASQPEIDGVLIGAGATNADVFAALTAAVVRARAAQTGGIET